MFYFIMAAVAAAVVGLDQWTKWLTVQNVPLYAEGKSILGIFSITHIENNGGAWGMLGSWGSMSGMGGMSAAFRFPLIFADILCVLGGIVIIGGVALAIIWKRRVQK